MRDRRPRRRPHRLAAALECTTDPPTSTRTRPGAGTEEPLDNDCSLPPAGSPSRLTHGPAPDRARALDRRHPSHPDPAPSPARAQRLIPGPRPCPVTTTTSDGNEPTPIATGQLSDPCFKIAGQRGHNVPPHTTPDRKMRLGPYGFTPAWVMTEAGPDALPPMPGRTSLTPWLSPER